MNATSVHKVLGIGLSFMLVACGGDTPAPEQSDAEPEAEVTPTPMSVSSGDITMSFYEYGPTAGGEQLPSFTISAADFSQGGGAELSFVDAEAVIYTESGDNLNIKAGAALMDEETQQASMTGGATVTRGTMTITLERLQWNNEKRMLVSDAPVRIRDGETAIDAASMEYDVDANTAVLKDATGHLVTKQGGPAS